MTGIIGIGNPLLDSTVVVDESFLERHGLTKGGMALVSEEQQSLILKDLPENKVRTNPGGSVANTLAAVKALGGEATFIGSIGDDTRGDLYEELITSRGVRSGLLRSKKQQGTCLVLITPDGERTFATCLGAALDLRRERLDETSIAQASIIHLEGYQLDGENNAEAVTRAISIAKENNVPISIDLSDVGVIERHPEQLSKIIAVADIIFANEAEARMMTKQEDEVAAAQQLATGKTLAVVKRGGEGSIIAHQNKLYRIPGFKVKVVNTNGAGDAYAGAFLQSTLEGKTISRAGTIASYVAAKAVKQEEAMITKNMADEVAMIGYSSARTREHHKHTTCK